MYWLPLELVVKIVKYLNYEDLLCLSVTCKYWNDVSKARPALELFHQDKTERLGARELFLQRTAHQFQRKYTEVVNSFFISFRQTAFVFAFPSEKLFISTTGGIIMNLTQHGELLGLSYTRAGRHTEDHLRDQSFVDYYNQILLHSPPVLLRCQSIEERDSFMVYSIGMLEDRIYYHLGRFWVSLGCIRKGVHLFPL